jgi:hypothetical protein
MDLCSRRYCGNQGEFRGKVSNSDGVPNSTQLNHKATN